MVKIKMIIPNLIYDSVARLARWSELVWVGARNYDNFNYFVMHKLSFDIFSMMRKNFCPQLSC